ncbi:MAG: hypothetical protein RSF67_07940, partial [Clostridia bacterium]
IKREMISSDEDIVEEYYGTQISVYKNIDKYLAMIPNIYDKIALAQWANNYTKVNELISSVEFDEQMNRKYYDLLKNNIDLNETIDLRILSMKYDFLNDMLDMITTNRDVQEQIISLSDEELKIFELLYNRVKETTEYRVPYITSLLNRMGTVTPFSYWQNKFYRYDELKESITENMENGSVLSEGELDNLLYLYTTNLVWDVKSQKELNDFTTHNGKFSLSVESIFNEELNKDNKNIEKIKNALLLKTYGIDLISACAICERYDLNSLSITDENIDLFEMYMAIINIINEDDSALLIELYQEFSKQLSPKPNFMRTVVFENLLRKGFAKDLTTSVYKCDQDYIFKDNVKVYDAGTDFKMIVTAIGAYQTDFNSGDNYKEYWNSPTIRSHGNCCSLIGNNNLSMANAKNVIFGFSSMDVNMLLLSSSMDINSTPSSKRFNIAQEEGNGSNRTIDGKQINSIGKMGFGIEFTNPDNLLNNTRGDYNELVYERRDLCSNPLFYKKNPDYIVFIEEYENIDDCIKKFEGNSEMLTYLREQRQLQIYQFEQSIKAAQDFNIPIVKINREKLAKNSSLYIENMMKLFEEKKDINLITLIICEFENNRFGNNDKHMIIRDSYFSKEKMDEYLSRIENTILTIGDDELKNKAFNIYYDAVIAEQRKVKRCANYRNNGQISAIDFDKTISRIELMSMENLTVENNSILFGNTRGN